MWSHPKGNLMKLLRVYNLLDVHAIKPNLLIYGDVSGQCGHCDAFDIKFSETKCPKCSADFKYIAFRNIKSHIPKTFKLFEERPQVKIVDFDDYKRNMGASKAEEFFK